MRTNDPRLDLSRAQVLSWAAVSTKIQDKYSIEDQLRMERDWCARQGATLVGELVVRGFSRDYWTLADVVNASQHDPDMEAFALLQAHIRKRDFTLFLCFDADRFGRTQSLVHEVIGRITRDCGALIYTLADGVWMDEESAPMIGTLKAFKAQQDVSKLKTYRAIGMDNRGREGKSTTAVMPLFHQRVRDEKGKEIAIVVNEDLRSLWTDLAVLILRGVPWESMEKTLFEEFGHGERGRAYRSTRMRALVYAPGFWGHAALNYRVADGRRMPTAEPWIWDAHVAPPSGVTIYRDRLPAVYSGDWAALGEQVKAELWRRYHLTGKATSHDTYRFHGLVVCDECGYTLRVARASGQPRMYLRCVTHFRDHHRLEPASCSQTKYVSGKRIQAYFDQEIRAALEGAPSLLFDTLNQTRPLQQRLDDERQQQKRFERRLDVLIAEISDAPEDARPRYRRQILDLSAQLARSIETIEVLQVELGATEQQQNAQANSLSYFRTTSIEDFWRLPDTTIHQALSLLLGRNQLVAREGRIIGIAPSTSHYILSRRERGSGIV